MTTSPSERPKREETERQRLLEAVYRESGFDFRDYAPASIHRRLLRVAAIEGIPSLPALQERVLRDPELLDRLLLALTVHTTEMFRDPSFFVAFREQVVPWLRTHPFVRVWVAGCSTGEEVYSLAILLHEEGVAERCRIYATDLSDAVVKRAASGIFPLSEMRAHSVRYQQAGGATSLSHTSARSTTSRS